MPPKAKRPDAVSEKKVRLYATLDEAWRAAGSRFAPPKATWGSPTLDRVTGGPRAGGLAVLAGFPRTGKTAFCVRAAVEAALGGKTVLYVSLDNDLSSIGCRVMGALCGKDLRGLSAGGDTERPLEKGHGEVPVSPEIPLYFYAESLDRIGGYQHACAQLKQDKGLDLVIIDTVWPFFQDSKSIKGTEADHQALYEFMIVYKLMAQDLDCQILTVLPLGDEFGSIMGPGIFVSLAEITKAGLPEVAVDLVFVVDLCKADFHLMKPDYVHIAILKNRYGPIARFRIPIDNKSYSLFGQEEPEESPVQYGRDGEARND